MNWDRIFFIAFFCVLLNVVTSGPLLGGETSTCYDYNCPARTTGCKKVMKTSEDKQSLVEIITCLDVQDYELDKHTKTSPNPYGPNTHYESTSFTGSYTFSGGHMQPININNHVRNTNDDVELFKK